MTPYRHIANFCLCHFNDFALETKPSPFEYLLPLGIGNNRIATEPASLTISHASKYTGQPEHPALVCGVDETRDDIMAFNAFKILVWLTKVARRGEICGILYGMGQNGKRIHELIRAAAPCPILCTDDSSDERPIEKRFADVPGFELAKAKWIVTPNNYASLRAKLLDAKLTEWKNFIVPPYWNPPFAERKSTSASAVPWLAGRITNLDIAGDRMNIGVLSELHGVEATVVGKQTLFGSEVACMDMTQPFVVGKGRSQMRILGARPNTIGKTTLERLFLGDDSSSGFAAMQLAMKALFPNIENYLSLAWTNYISVTEPKLTDSVPVVSQTTPLERLVLSSLAFHCAPLGDIVEIGRFGGGGTQILAKALKLSGSRHKVLSIDPWVEISALAMSGFSFHNLHSIIDVIVDYSDNVWPIIKNRRPTMVFIDGNHHYKDVRKDAFSALEAVVSGTIIAFHDFTNEFTGTMNAIAEMAATGAVDCLFRADSIIVFKRR